MTSVSSSERMQLTHSNERKMRARSFETPEERLASGSARIFQRQRCARLQKTHTRAARRLATQSSQLSGHAEVGVPSELDSHHDRAHLAAGPSLFPAGRPTTSSSPRPIGLAPRDCHCKHALWLVSVQGLHVCELSHFCSATISVAGRHCQQPRRSGA